MKKLQKISNGVHFIGIGGIGVSALAQHYLKEGYQVSGSDLVSSELIQSLKKKGIKVSLGKQRAGNLPKKLDLVVFSPAVKKDNPELKEARKRKVKTLSYPQALGQLTKEHFTIAVSGTHGKSTTTSMLGLLLAKAGLDPTVIVGTKLKEFGNSNFRPGKSRYLVIEADEHFASFLNYWPEIIVLTSIEADHLDYYKTLNNLILSFKRYVSHLPKQGVLVLNADDKNSKKVLAGKREFLIKKYSLKQKEAKKLRKLLKVPGEYNVANALAALTLARVLAIPDKVSFSALREYKGSWRRFETYPAKGFILISDYGHHPTEVKVTLEAARKRYPKERIWSVFQPHQYQRTYYLFNEFVKVLKRAPIDRLILTDIYDVAGREGGALKKKVSSQKLAEKIKSKKVIYLAKEKLLNYLKKQKGLFDVLIIMGAGDIYLLVDSFRAMSSLTSSSPSRFSNTQALTKRRKKRKI